MKKVRQASRVKEKGKTFFIFANIEQFVSFLFLIIVILLSSWVVVVVKSWIENPERVVLSQLILTGDHAFTTEDDIRSAILGLGLPNTYIAQDVDDIQKEILRLSWVKQVSVRKQWPDRLMVNVVEREPNYVWNDLFLLDKNGDVFSIPKERFNPSDLPKLSGPVRKEKLILDTYLQLNAIATKLANKNIILTIEEANADDRNAWQLRVRLCITEFCTDHQSIILKLGREKILERYERFIRFYNDIQQNLLADEQFIEVDLRYESGIAVKKQKIKIN